VSGAAKDYKSLIVVVGALCACRSAVFTTFVCQSSMMKQGFTLREKKKKKKKHTNLKLGDTRFLPDSDDKKKTLKKKKIKIPPLFFHFQTFL
jgi:hypothetical protein